MARSGSPQRSLVIVLREGKIVEATPGRAMAADHDGNAPHSAAIAFAGSPSAALAIFDVPLVLALRSARLLSKLPQPLRDRARCSLNSGLRFSEQGD